MAIRILGNGVEVRKPGFTPKNKDILAGKAVTLDVSDTSGKTIKLAGATDTLLGLALENNVTFTNTLIGYDDYNRGGLVSCVSGSGFEVEVFNDGRGDIFDSSKSYSLNDKIFVGANGILTNVDAGSATYVGFVTKAPATATDTMKIQIAL